MAQAQADYSAGRAAYAAATAASYRNVASKCEIKDLDRRSRCEHDLLQFLKEYDPAPFYLGFSEDHKRLISDTQRVILEGGNRIAIAMPRGSGKTVLLTRSILWSAVYGHKRFPILITAADPHFRRVLQTIKTILLYSEPLAEDFPEVCGPIREIDDKAIRCAGQHWDKTPTAIQWTREMVRFPITPMSKERNNAGIALSGGGILGSLRGMNTTLPTGEVVRPDLALFDDVQTRRSAESMAQCEERMSAIYDSLSMTGPTDEMAALMACTVISPDDVSDRILSPERPEWISHRIPTLKSFPENMGAWDRYAEIRRAMLLQELPRDAANKHYEENREALDKGAEHYWPEKIDAGKVSAIQSAMDMWLEDSRSFMSEQQNDPEYARAENQLDDKSPMEVGRRTRPFKAGVIPAECTTLVAHIDVQSEILFWVVMAFTESFGGHIVDYGTWPERSKRYFTLDQIKRGRTLSKTYPKADEVGRIRSGVRDTIQRLNREWTREGGTTLTLSRLLVDGGYQLEAVERAVRDAGCPVGMVARGVGISATNMPMIQWSKKPGQRSGTHWLIRALRQGRPMAHVDVNYWKTEVHTGLTLDDGHTNAITLFEGNLSHHQMIADHLCSEVGVKVEALGRTVIEWKLRKPGIDNHYLDNVVGCMAAASMSGVTKIEYDRPKAKKGTPKKKRIRKLTI